MEQALQSANARVEELHRVLKQNVALQVGACVQLLPQKHPGPAGKCASSCSGQTLEPVLRERRRGKGGLHNQAVGLQLSAVQGHIGSWQPRASMKPASWQLTLVQADLVLREAA